MTQHFTRNTVSVAFYCPKCQKFTQHRIDHEKAGAGRKGPCLDCIAKLEVEHAKRDRWEREDQGSLFT
jgi:ribosomal protein L44E